MLVKFINYGAATVLVIFGIVTLAWIPEVSRGFGREPEDLWLALLWTAFLLGVAALCIWNGRFEQGNGRIWSIKAWLNLAVIFAVGLAMIFGDDPLGRLLLVLVAIGPLAWSAGWAARVSQPN